MLAEIHEKLVRLEGSVARLRQEVSSQIQDSSDSDQTDNDCDSRPPTPPRPKFLNHLFRKTHTPPPKPLSNVPITTVNVRDFESIPGYLNPRVVLKRLPESMIPKSDSESSTRAITGSPSRKKTKVNCKFVRKTPRETSDEETPAETRNLFLDLPEDLHDEFFVREAALYDPDTNMVEYFEPVGPLKFTFGNR